MKITQEITLIVSREELKMMNDVISTQTPWRGPGKSLSDHEHAIWVSLRRVIEEALE